MANTLKKALLISVTAAAFSPTATALAQDADKAVSIFAEEIIVTARKREEGVQDVPIAISAYTAASLDARGIVSTEQIAAFTPNLTFQNNPGFSGGTNIAAVYIRGVGQFDFLGSIEPGVGMYVDGVYLARSVGGIMDLVDIERLEVLRGPQGTLFGRNTIGGAINITTVKPSDELSGKASALFGDDNRIEFRASANVPVNDTLFVRLSGAYLARDGYVERIFDNPAGGNDLGNKDSIIGRLQVRWEPTDNFTVDFSIDGTRDESNGTPFVTRGARTSSLFFNPNQLPIVPPFDPNMTTGGGGEGGGMANPFFFPFNLAETGGTLPPGVAPGFFPADQQFYQLNPPFDAPTDNFGVLANYLSSFPPPGAGAPSGCLNFFEPYTGFGSADACFGPQWFEGSIGRFRNAGSDPSFSESSIWGASLDLNYDLGNVQMRSITAYRSIKSEFANDFDGTPIAIASLVDSFDQEQISQELQVLGQAFDDRLNWIVGGFYFKEDVDNLNDVIFTPVTVRSGGVIENKSLALFGQATYELTSQLSVTAGLRWTKDDKTFDSNPYQFILQSNVGPGIAGGFDSCPGAQTAAECTPENDTDGIPNNGPFSVFDARQSEQNAKELNPYVNLSYKWTDDILTYFSFSQGFKSGGFTQRVFPPLPEIPSVDPETVDAFEVGFKSMLLEGMLRLNGAAFYSNYNDIQVQGFTVDTGVAPIYFNLASGATIKGFELDYALFLPDGWYMEGAVGYTDAAYDEDGFPTGALVGVTADSAFERVSKWVATAAVQKTIDLGSAGTLTPRFDWAYRSAFANDASNVPEITQPSYSVFNSTVRWESEGGAYTFLVGVNNIFDKDYFFSGIFNNNEPTFKVIPNRGREWYARIGAAF